MKKLLCYFLSITAIILILAVVISAQGEKSLYAFDQTYTAENPLGENTYTLALSENAEHTLFIFSPDETGIYTFTVSEGATIGWWGAYSMYVRNPESSARQIECDIKAVGNIAVIGIASDNPEVTLTINKTAESEGLIEIDYVNYVNEHTPTAGIYPPSKTVRNVDITKPHTAVKGLDGAYRLDYENGPLLYIDLYHSDFNLGNAFGSYGALTMRGEYDGVFYDFKSAMKQYNEVLKETSGIYPLTDDLIRFVQGYGARQQWYQEEFSPFKAIAAGTADPDTAWMVMCCTEVKSYSDAPLIKVEDNDKTTPLIIEYRTENHIPEQGIYYDLSTAADGAEVSIIGSSEFKVIYNEIVYHPFENDLIIQTLTKDAVILIEGEGVFDIVLNTHIVCDKQYVEMIFPTHTESGIIGHWRCTVCEKKYSSESSSSNVITNVLLSPAGHTDAVWHDEKEPTCHEYGNTGYWYCAECNKKYDGTDADSKQLSNSDITIPKLAHTWSGVGEKNEDGHSFKCSVCGESGEQKDHSYADSVCTVCGYQEPRKGFFEIIGEFFKNLFANIKALFVRIFD